MSMKKINGYIIHMKEVLGKGSYGAVYKGEQEQTKKSCAIKVIDKKQSNIHVIQSFLISISKLPFFNKYKFCSKSDLKTLSKCMKLWKAPITITSFNKFVKVIFKNTSRLTQSYRKRLQLISLSRLLMDLLLLLKKALSIGTKIDI